MPTYEYKCKECGEGLEVVQSFTDEALTDCPACGGPLRKVFGSIGITFKGSGFYKTDSRGASGSPATKVGADGAKSDNGSSTSENGSSSSSDGASKSTDTSSAKPASDGGSKPSTDSSSKAKPASSSSSSAA
ncbi:MAG: FmdB family transcriptional regulator [Acidimicrobiia bacterium]|nr:FmdB family transcriptional regulator [Acidimicrobiia bacterium]